MEHKTEDGASELSFDEDSKSSDCSSGQRFGVKRKEDFEKSVQKKEKRNIDSNYCEGQNSDIYGNEDSDLEYGLSDSDDTVLNQLHTDSNQTTKRKKPLGPLQLHFNCEWRNCSYGTDEDLKFHLHVSYHIPDLEIKTLANGDEVYKCLWAECNYLTKGVKEIQRHVTYHSYHTKLKNIGTRVIEEWNLPKCMYGNETRNMIPDQIEPMICEWNECNKEINNVQVFLHHIQLHINENFNETGAKKERIKCKWEGCTLRSKKMERAALTNHVRTHTQEKAVGCPTCGHLFATNTKLVDHCERQLPQELSGFRCNHCYKCYPSLRLLRDHMRGHVNFYKCCYCDMTCTSRHTFTAHIRYKHLDCKPFKCNICEYRCKTQQDLKSHLTSHDPTPQFECVESGCGFSCRSKRTLQRHMTDDHQSSPSPVYACHLPNCNSSYKRGCYLTQHLIKKHCLRWPSGHSKFMYHREEDGIYRLQTVRYESIKLNGENKSTLPPKSKYKLTPQPGQGSRSFKVSPVESDCESSISQVFISIEDEKGNTINCCTAPSVANDRIPKNATVIATADSDS